jgi:hypothetical protein
MAGSYNHTVNDDGQLIDSRALAGMLDTGGDVYEAIEEMYGMIWYLATTLAAGNVPLDIPEGWVAEAQRNYVMGINYSPGLAKS